MRRRDFLYVPLFPWTPLVAWQDAGAPEPVPEPHFPSRLHQFIWRNWELATTDRMAKVLRTMPHKVLELGLSMGLPEKRTLTPNQFRRLYITVIRQNWHLLPENQIIELLGWTQDKYRFTLKEDDFLDSKLGLPKPRCSQLLYATPTEEEQARAAQIRNIVEETFGASIHVRGEDLLQFIQELSDRSPRRSWSASAQSQAGEIELTEGWTIIEPSGDVLASAARRFKGHLKDAMGAHIALSPAALATGKRIRLAVLGGAAQAGVLQGRYWLLFS
jgi:hypothetical protein